MTVRRQWKLPLAVSLTAAALTGASLAAGPANAATVPAKASAAAGDVHAMNGAVGPYRLKVNGAHAKDKTPYFDGKRSHARICFNVWGKNLNKGYHITLRKNAWSVGSNELWGDWLWGPVHKRCSPWKKTKKTIYAELARKYGGLSKKATATADVWLYWY